MGDLPKPSEFDVATLAELPRFEYSRLARSVADEARATASNIQRLNRRIVEDVVAIGEGLQRIKDKLGYGEFGDWLKAECNMTPRNAQLYMAAWRRLGAKANRVSHLPLRCVFKLLAPYFSDAVCQKVLDSDVPMDRQKLEALIAEEHERALDRRRRLQEMRDRAYRPRKRALKQTDMARHQRMQAEASLTVACMIAAAMKDDLAKLVAEFTKASQSEVLAELRKRIPR